MDDAQFLTVISIIVARHGCRISHVDCEHCVVDIDGPDDATEDCAIDIANTLRRYAV